MHNRTRVGRRSIIAGAAAAALLPQDGHGQSDYPNRIVRIIVPYPPGGGVDVTARVSGAAMAQFLGQNIVIENRAGAGGPIGSGAVATAAPDGYTLLMHSSAHVANQHLMANLPFHYATAFMFVWRRLTGCFILEVKLSTARSRSSSSGGHSSRA